MRGIFSWEECVIRRRAFALLIAGGKVIIGRWECEDGGGGHVLRLCIEVSIPDVEAGVHTSTILLSTHWILHV